MYRHRFVILASFVCSILIALTYIPQIVRSTKTRGENVSTLLFNSIYPTDTYVYYSAITRGQNGYLLYDNPWYVEPYKPLPLYLYYIVLGQITGPLHISPPVVYQIGKLIAIAAFAGSIYFVARSFLFSQKNAAISVITALTATTLPDWWYSAQVAQKFYPWWTEKLSAIIGLDNRPHYVLGHAMLLFSIGFFVQAVRRKNIRLATFASLFGALTALSVPHAAIPFYITVLIIGTASRFWAGSAIAVLPALCISGILSALSAADPLWNWFRGWEVSQWNGDPFFYFHLYSTYIFLLIPASLTWIHGILKRNVYLISLFLWSVSVLLFAPISPVLEISKGRLLHFTVLIPIVLSAVNAVSSILPHVFPKKIRTLTILAFFLFTTVMIAYQARALWQSIASESTAYSDTYVRNDYMDAADALKSFVTRDTHILSGPQLGTIIPAFLPVRVYVGHSAQSFPYDVKLAAATRFYSQAMTDTEAKQFLTDNKLALVLDDQETLKMEKAPLTYPFLVPVWKNASVIIYRVN